MKKWLTYFLLLISITLTACTTKREYLNSDKEQLKAFLISQHKLYVVGQHYDYQFDGGDIKHLQDFLTSEYTQTVFYADAKLEIHDGKNVKGYYHIYLDPNKLSQNEIGLLNKRFGFMQKELPQELHIKQPMLMKVFQAEGMLAKLQNHDELLTKYKISTPLQAEVKYYKNQVKLNDGVSDIGGGLLAPILIPAVAVITLPIFIMITYCKPDNC